MLVALVFSLALLLVDHPSTGLGPGVRTMLERIDPRRARPGEEVRGSAGEPIIHAIER